MALKLRLHTILTSLKESLDWLGVAKDTLCTIWFWIPSLFAVDLYLQLYLIAVIGWISIPLLHSWLIICLYFKNKHEVKVDNKRTSGWETDKETEEVIKELAKTKRVPRY
jgi:hypothetical protein